MLHAAANDDCLQLQFVIILHERAYLLHSLTSIKNEYIYMYVHYLQQLRP